MQIVPLLLRRFVLLNRNAVRVGPGVLTNARHLPGELHACLASRDLEAIATEFLGNIDWGIVSNTRQLIAELGVEGVEPGRQGDLGCSLGIEATIPS